MAGSINLVHEGRVFEHCTVYMSGNAFYNCRFFRCTLVLRESKDLTVIGCTFECCNWHLDFLVHDYRTWENFTRIMGPLIHQSLPRAFLGGSETAQPGDAS